MLAPPVLVLVCEPVLGEPRSSGVFSPLPLLVLAVVKADAGLAHTSRRQHSKAATCAAARGGVSLVIEDDSEEESPPVIGPHPEVLRASAVLLAFGKVSVRKVYTLF
jgi:hypothetical protein